MSPGASAERGGRLRTDRPTITPFCRVLVFSASAGNRKLLRDDLAGQGLSVALWEWTEDSGLHDWSQAPAWLRINARVTCMRKPVRPRRLLQWPGLALGAKPERVADDDAHGS